jgi:hypothetical protein
MLTNLKFWALAAALVWIVAVTAVIAMNPGYALGAS